MSILGSLPHGLVVIDADGATVATSGLSRFIDCDECGKRLRVKEIRHYGWDFACAGCSTSTFVFSALLPCGEVPADASPLRCELSSGGR